MVEESAIKHTISISIQQLADLMALSNARHFKIKPEHLDQWVANRSRDYIAAAGYAVRLYLIELPATPATPAPPVKLIHTSTTNEEDL